MARSIRERDWAAGGFEPLTQWPAELKLAVDLMLGAAVPMALFWGDELVTIFNDAWLARIARRDATSLGEGAASSFGASWPRIEPRLRYVLSQGRPSETLDFRLPAQAGGAWFDFDFSPLPGAGGTTGGVLALAREATARHEAAAALRDAEARFRADLDRQTKAATAELKASHDLLQATMDASTDMIQVFDAVRDARGEIVDFRWVLNNHTSAHLYGEVQDDSLLTRNPGVVQEGIFDAFRRVTETGVPEQAERYYAHEQCDGWFYQTVVKLNDGVATTTRDISAWKQAQAEVLRLQEEAGREALLQSEERFRSFAENSTDVLWLVDAQTRQLVYLSPAFERIWGERREHVLADLGRWAELVHPEDRALAMGALPRALKGEPVQIVYRITRPSDGTRRWIQDTEFPIRNAEGRVVHIGGVSQDVTDQRETAERLRENQRRLRAVIEGIPQLVWRSAEGGRWIWASPQWSAYTGQSETESHGLGWLDALHPDDRAGAEAGWHEADGSAPIAMETRLYHVGEKSYRWFQTRALPLKDEDGRIVEWLGTSTDVDDLFQLRERQQVLVAELQHRTRNLIGVVRSMAEKTASGAESLDDFLPRYKERLAALSRINTLLSLLETGERITFDVLLRAELEARGVFDGDGAERIRLDGPAGVRLRSSTVQIFALAIHELTTNAVKYGALGAPQGRLSVDWSTRRGDDGTERLHVEWIESGVADMPPENAPPRGGGFGRMLIEQALPFQLRAGTTYSFRPDGLRCTIELPLH